MVTNCHEETETLFSRPDLVAAKIHCLIVLYKRVVSMTYEYELPFIRQLSFVAYEFGLLRASSAYGSFIKPAGAAPADPGLVPWFLQAEIADPRTENFEVWVASFPSVGNCNSWTSAPAITSASIKHAQRRVEVNRPCLRVMI